MAAPSGGDRSTPASTISPTTCHSYKLAPIHAYRGRRWGCEGKRASGTILSPWTSPYNCQLLASCFSKLASADRDRGKPAFRWPEKLIFLCARIYSKLQDWYLAEKTVSVFSKLSIMYWSIMCRWWPKKGIFTAQGHQKQIHGKQLQFDFRLQIWVALFKQRQLSI